MKKYNIEKNRSVKNYSRKEIVLRILWGLGKIIFKSSPRIAFSFRNSILRLFGAKVGKNVHIYPSAVITYPWNLKIDQFSSIGENALIYNLGNVEIGKRSTISQNSHLCAGTHDYTQDTMPLIKGKIKVEDDVWVCADAFIGPNIKIGRGAIIGARSVVLKDVSPNNIVGGNPAKFIKYRDEN